MIVGIGTDIVHIVRIERAFSRQGLRFAGRILGQSELLNFEQRLQQHPKRGIRYLATRFAAKEAFAKALGLGIREIMHWHALEILNDGKGQPYAETHGALQHWLSQRQIKIHLSLSDEAEYALAFVTLERHASDSGN